MATAAVQRRGRSTESEGPVRWPFTSLFRPKSRGPHKPRWPQLKTTLQACCERLMLCITELCK